MDYASKGVKFFYIYKSLAHPENGGYVSPFNLEERLMHVDEAKRTLGSKIPWICDSMKNDLKHALGDRPNSEYIVDPQGRVVVARAWSDPRTLRSDLERLVGPVDPPTSIADVGLRPLPPPQRAATGVVPRIQLPGQMSPLKIEPLSTDEKHYVKLRAESSSGSLYLGFFLDPLYKVHWNNEAPAMEFRIETPDGVTVLPAAGKGPEVDVDADADPREFLLKLVGHSREPLELTVKYFACDDAETFCKPLTQVYRIFLERDRDGGSRRSPRSGGSRAFSPAMFARLPIWKALDKDQDGKISAIERESAADSLRRLDANADGELSLEELRPIGAGQQIAGRLDIDSIGRMDRNRDGFLSRQELPAQMARRFSQMDRDGDGRVSNQEFRSMMQRRFGNR